MRGGEGATGPSWGDSVTLAREKAASFAYLLAAPDGVLFERTYTCVGQGHAGAVVAAGAFAMKAAMRETTDEALRSCFAQFLADARPLAPTWATALRTAHRGA